MERGLQHAGRLDEQAKAVTVFVQLRGIDRRQEAPSVTAASLNDIVQHEAIQHTSQRASSNTIASHQVRLCHVVGKVARKAVAGHALHQLVVFAHKVRVRLEVLIAYDALEDITSTRNYVEQASLGQHCQCSTDWRP